MTQAKEAGRTFSPSAFPLRKSQATVLVELGKEAELFHTPEGEPCASVEINDHRETWSIKRNGFRDWLMRRFYESEGAAPSAQAMQDALGVLSGDARFGSAEGELFTRVAAYQDAIYLDLCDADWRAVRITPEGWEVMPHGDVKFRRTKGMLALPEPVCGGLDVDMAVMDWREMARRHGVSEQDVINEARRLIAESASDSGSA